MAEQWTIEPVTKEQAGRSQYMALIAPNGKILGMFYEPNIAKTLIKRINLHDELVDALKTTLTVLENYIYGLGEVRHTPPNLLILNTVDIFKQVLTKAEEA